MTGISCDSAARRKSCIILSRPLAWNIEEASGSLRVGVVAKGDLDWALEAMDVTVVASSLVSLVFLAKRVSVRRVVHGVQPYPHQRDEILGLPSLHLEVVIVAGRSSGVPVDRLVTRIPIISGILHHEIDGAPTTQNVGAGNDSSSSIEIFRGSGIVETGCLGV